MTAFQASSSSQKLRGNTDVLSTSKSAPEVTSLSTGTGAVFLLNLESRRWDRLPLHPVQATLGQTATGRSGKEGDQGSLESEPSLLGLEMS